MLIDEIIKVSQDDQKFRSTIQQAIRTHGQSSKEVIELWRYQHELDYVNQKKIRAIINEYGYPGKTLVGEKYKNVAFLVIQHADLEMQEEFFPLLFEEAKKDELDRLPILMLVDRIHLKKYGKQIHRSQSILNQQTGKYEPAPIDNTINPNEIRVALGFKPLSPIQNE
jgi:hypothetical protein